MLYREDLDILKRKVFCQTSGRDISHRKSDIGKALRRVNNLLTDHIRIRMRNDGVLIVNCHHVSSSAHHDLGRSIRPGEGVINEILQILQRNVILPVQMIFTVYQFFPALHHLVINVAKGLLVFFQFGQTS